MSVVTALPRRTARKRCAAAQKTAGGFDTRQSLPPPAFL